MKIFSSGSPKPTAAFQLLEKSVRGAFGGYGKFRRLLKADNQSDRIFRAAEMNRWPSSNASATNSTAIWPASKNFRCRYFSGLFPIWLTAGFCWASRWRIRCWRILINITFPHFKRGMALAGLAVVLVIYVIGLRAAAPLAKIIAGEFVRARSLLAGRPGKGGGGIISPNWNGSSRNFNSG